MTRKTRLAALIAAVMILCPLGTGAGKLDELTGRCYIVEGDQAQQTVVSTSGDGSSAGSSSGKLNSFVTDGSIRVSDLLEVAEDYSTVPKDFLDDMRGKGSITVAQFRKYMVDYKLPGQYSQRFIDDYFVFKQGNTFQYLPVESSATKHRYNWDNLVHYTYEKDYVAGGSSRALKGIDVSVFQGNINWKSVKADGVDFAFIRLGYRGYSNGAIKIDSNFHKNIQGAQAAGVRVGAYFYSQATSRSEAIAEADFCLDELRGYSLDMPVVFDFEGAASSAYRTYGMGTQSIVNVIKAFCDAIEDGGYKSMYYSYAKYLAEHEGMVSQLEDYDLWMAMYYRVPFFPYNFKIWQYSSSGRVSGISGNVDMNLLFLDYQPS